MTSRPDDKRKQIVFCTAVVTGLSEWAVSTSVNAPTQANKPTIKGSGSPSLLKFSSVDIATVPSSFTLVRNAGVKYHVTRAA